MELNPNGTIKASSVRDARRVVLKPKESESIKYRLATVQRGRVKLGEIAVLEDREWLRVNPVNHRGLAWIEVEPDTPFMPVN